MNLAAALIPDSLDSKQALRLRRFGIAVLSYMVAAALVAVAWVFGAIPAQVVVEVACGFIAYNLGLYAAIRSGFNLRFADPSFTRFQILAGITFLMFIVYHMDDGRDVALFACFIVFPFGMFRLETREFTVVTLYTLAAYALVINLLMHLRPEAIQSVPHEWMSWVGLAGVLPCFTLIAGQINALRLKLRDSADELRLFADNVPAMTASFDQHQRCVFANKPYAEFFDLDAAAVVGKHVREIVGEDAYKEIERHFEQALRGHPVTYRRTRRLSGGENRSLEVKLMPHLGQHGKIVGLFAVTADISEHMLAEERIQRVAHHDSLTGLPNRLLFNDRLDQAIGVARRDGSQFALLYLDLDRFKPVNDALGHAAGDELLKGVAARIRQQVRESDTVARMGGDEFAVILPAIARREEAENVAGKISAAIAAPFQLGSARRSVEIGASIGVALYPSEARDADALVKAADAAMYHAKHAGSSVAA